MIPQHRSEDILTIPGGLESGGCFWQFQGIGIESVETASRDDSGEERPGMASVAQSRINPRLARLRIQRFENFRHHDRQMAPGRSFSGSNDLGDSVRIFFRVQFFVFLIIAPGIFPSIAWPTTMRRRRNRAVFRVWIPVHGGQGLVRKGSGATSAQSAGCLPRFYDDHKSPPWQPLAPEKSPDSFCF